jgi:uncharacterized protein YkwD
MKAAFPDVRFVLAALLLAAGLALAVAPPTADAKGPCNHGGKTPTQLGKKQARNSVICLINQRRDGNGRGNLKSNGKLIEAARKHSGTMARKGCFSHECRGEKSLLGRLKAVHYIHGGLSRWAYGENIAYGGGKGATPREVVSDWMRSSGHRGNILSRTFEDIGVGFHNKGTKGYYTADFGLAKG